MLALKYDNGLIPVIVQDAATREVLMMAYANGEAVRLTTRPALPTITAGAGKKLWKKGEESGHFQKVLRILADCDEDCLIYEVQQTGAACHNRHAVAFSGLWTGKLSKRRFLTR